MRRNECDHGIFTHCKKRRQKRVCHRRGSGDVSFSGLSSPRDTFSFGVVYQAFYGLITPLRHFMQTFLGLSERSVGLLMAWF